MRTLFPNPEAAKYNVLLTSFGKPYHSVPQASLAGLPVAV